MATSRLNPRFSRVFRIITMIARAVLLFGLGVAPALAADPARRCVSSSRSPKRASIPRFASDAASDAIIGNVFDAMLDYDYLARPVKLVPRGLEALPTVEEGGRTYLVQRHARASTSRPIPRSRASRASSTAADYAYRLQAHPRSGGQVAVAVAARRQARRRRRGCAARAEKTGKFDYDAPLPGLDGRRSLYAADPSEVARTCAFRTCSQCRTWRRWRARSSRRTVRTSARIRSAPGRTCSGEYRRSAKIVLIANPGFRDIDV